MLTDENRLRLDGIVQAAQQNGESDDFIQAMVNDYKSKYDQPEPGMLDRAADALKTAYNWRPFTADIQKPDVNNTPPGDGLGLTNDTTRQAQNFALEQAAAKAQGPWAVPETGIVPALKSGAENNVTGLAIRAAMGKKGMPTPYVPQNIPEAIAQQGASIAGDLPVFLPAAAIGSAAAATNPITAPAAPAAGMGAGFAATDYVRQAMQDQLSGKDMGMLERIQRAAGAGGHGFVTGAATGAAGAMAPAGTKLLAEALTMPTAAAAQEGRLPTGQEMADSVITIAAIKAAGKLPQAARILRDQVGSRFTTDAEALATLERAMAEAPAVTLDDLINRVRTEKPGSAKEHAEFWFDELAKDEQLRQSPAGKEGLTADLEAGRSSFLTPDIKDTNQYIDNAIAAIKSGYKGGKVFHNDGTITGYKSANPEWFQRSGLSVDEARSILEKAQTGAPLTDRQRAFVDEAIAEEKATTEAWEAEARAKYFPDTFLKPIESMTPKEAKTELDFYNNLEPLDGDWSPYTKRINAVIDVLKREYDNKLIDSQPLVDNTNIDRAGPALLSNEVGAVGDLTSLEKLGGMLRVAEEKAKQRGKSVEQYFAEDLKLGPNQIKAIMQRGDKIATMEKRRKFSETLQQVPTMPEELKDFAATAAPFNYQPITNIDTMGDAMARVQVNKAAADAEFSRSRGKLGADKIALGEALLTDAIRNGEYSQAREYMVSLAERLTEAGQTVQAAKMIKSFSPEHMLLYGQRSLENAANTFFEKTGKKLNVQFTETEMAQIANLVRGAMETTGREADILRAKAQQIIANKMPRTFGEKWKAYMRIAMLLNGKTVLRNVGGNVILAGMEFAKDVPGAAIDRTMGAFTGQRTTYAPTMGSIVKYVQGFKNGIKRSVEDARLGIDTSLSRTSTELPYGRTFDNSMLNAFDQTSRLALRITDNPFYEGAYEKRLYELQKAGGATTIDMQQEAQRYAADLTLQNDSTAAAIANQLKRALNMAGVRDVGTGDFVLPFSKTPANILDKAVDYSPAAVVKLVRQLIHAPKQQFDQKKFVDTAARSLTGTGLMALGMALAKSGVVTGKSDKDKDVARFEQDAGYPEYSWNVGGESYTWDWAQPMAVPLAVGVDMYRAGVKGKDLADALVKGGQSGVETVFKQSLMRGLQRLFGGYSPAAGIAETLVGGATMNVPTVMKQAARYGDEVERNTYDPSGTQQTINRVKATIPGMREELPPRLDAFGRPVEAQDSGDVWAAFFSPAIKKRHSADPVIQRVLEVEKATGKKEVVPPQAPTQVTFNGQKYQLNATERQAWQKEAGALLYQQFKRIDPNLPDELAAQRMVKIINAIQDRQRARLVRDLVREGKLKRGRQGAVMPASEDD